MSVTVKTSEEIKILREGGEKLAAIRDALANMAKPGVSAAELERKAEKLFTASGGEPSFFMHREKSSDKPFPARSCISVNDAIVHGVPHKHLIFKEGDLVGIDVGLKYKGLFTDTAVTVLVKDSRFKIQDSRMQEKEGEKEKLLRVTKKALDVGIGETRAGATTGDIGCAIEQFVQSSGTYGIVRTLCGHGVGYAVHEEPKIPNFGKRGEGAALKAGMVIAIEPMLTLGGEKLVLDADGFTFRSADGSLSAHFEHTLAVTEKGADILTAV
ncbi:MAG: type I methionyl aminopeptidase [Patescibacteria group bacterium]